MWTLFIGFVVFLTKKSVVEVFNVPLVIPKWLFKGLFKGSFKKWRVGTFEFKPVGSLLKKAKEIEEKAGEKVFEKLSTLNLRTSAASATPVSTGSTVSTKIQALAQFQIRGSKRNREDRGEDQKGDQEGFFPIHSPKEKEVEEGDGLSILDRTLVKHRDERRKIFVAFAIEFVSEAVPAVFKSVIEKKEKGRRAFMIGSSQRFLY